jgi:hypothetical protein
MSNGRLGDRLIQAGLITKAQLDKALEEQKRTGGLIGSNLIKLGFLKEEELLHFLSKQFGFPAVDRSSRSRGWSPHGSQAGLCASARLPKEPASGGLR